MSIPAAERPEKTYKSDLCSDAVKLIIYDCLLTVFHVYFCKQKIVILHFSNSQMPQPP